MGQMGLGERHYNKLESRDVKIKEGVSNKSTKITIACLDARAIEVDNRP